MAQQPNSTKEAAPPAAETADDPPAADAVVKGYAVDDGVDLERVVADLKKRYVRVPDIKIAADARTKKVIVVAPADVQADVAQWVPKLAATQGKPARPADDSPKATHIAPPLRNGVKSTASAQPAAPHSLKHIAWRDLEFGLQKLWGANLPINASEDGQSIVVSFPGRWNPAPTMQVDLKRRLVTFAGAAEAQQSLARLVAALDRPADTAAANTQIVPVTGGNPERVQTAVAALHSALQTDDAPARPAPKAARPANAPDAEGDADGGDDDDNGLIGPVQIEFLDGLDVIVVMGKKRDVDRVTKIIQDIEKLTAETKPTVQVYPLKQTNSQAMADLIVQVYTQVLSSRQGAVSITGLVKPNAILLVGRTEAVATVVELIEKLDQPVEPDAMLKVYQLKFMSAPDAETTIRNFFGIRAAGAAGALGQGGPLGGGIPGGGGAAALQGAGAAGGPGGGPGGGAASAGVNLATRMNIAIDNRTNSLIIQASPRDLAEIERLLEQIDVENGAATSELRIFKLSNTLAQDLERVLQGAIRGQATAGAGAGAQGAGAQPFGQAQPGGAAGGATNTQGTPRPTNLQFVMVDSLQKTVMASGISSDVFVTADVAGNALVVRAPTKSMELLAAIIKELDSMPAAESQIKVFTVTNGDATSLTQMLQLLFGQQVTAGRGQGGAFGAGALAQPLNALAANAGGPNAGESILVPLRFAVDARTNSIIVSGSSGDLRVVEALLLRLDEGDVPRRRLTVYRLKNAMAQDVANSITQLLQQQRQVINQNQIFNQAIGPFEQLEREFLIQAEPQTNCLVISATPAFYVEIIKMVEDLDFRPPMVMIQVLLAEVQLDNLYELGVELGLQDSLLYDRGRTGVGTSTPGFNFNNAGVPSPNLPNNSNTSRNALAAQGLSNFSLSRISPTAGYGGLVLSAASDSVNILVRALQQSGRLQVLSRPQVMAIHNRQAQVIVGQRVPRVQGTTQTTTAVTQNIVDTDIGLILNIIPQINKDGIVLMNIQAENSALSQSPQDSLTVPSGNSSVTIPAINTTSAVTTISAKDGQTVVFAGLIQNSKTITTRRVPYLSDVPVLGELFQYNSNQQRRRELLIVMTPKIIQHDEDYDWVKATESERMNWCLSDVVNIHGDVGLRGGSCLMCGDTVPVVYPDKNPTAQYYEMQPQEALPYQDLPTPSNNEQGMNSNRRTGPVPQMRALEPTTPYSAEGDEPVSGRSTNGGRAIPYGSPSDSSYTAPAGYTNPQSANPQTAPANGGRAYGPAPAPSANYGGRNNMAPADPRNTNRYPVAPANYPANDANRNYYPPSNTSPR